MSDTQPWHDGVWISSDMTSHIAVIKGTECSYKRLVYLDYPDIMTSYYGTLELGDFGDTPDDIREMSGVDRLNIKIKSPMYERTYALSEDGKRMYRICLRTGEASVMELADETRLKQLSEDREPIDAPNLPPYYTLKPNQPGKLVWFSGPPASGKSTCAQLMARHYGYTYYEGDAFFVFLNPFVDVNVENPSGATFSQQKPLKGVPVDTIRIISNFSKSFVKMYQGSSEGLEEAFLSVIPTFTNHIKKQCQRVGGDVAIAFAFFTRKQREAVRKYLGEVVFLVLNLTRECQTKRINSRNAGKGATMDFLHKMYDLYEPAGDDEENAFNLTITEDMTPDDIIKEAQKIIQKL